PVTSRSDLFPSAEGDRAAAPWRASPTSRRPSAAVRHAPPGGVSASRGTSPRCWRPDVRAAVGAGIILLSGSGGPDHLARDELRHGARGVSRGLLRRPTPVAMRDSRRRLNTLAGAATRTPT